MTKCVILDLGNVIVRVDPAQLYKKLLVQPGMHDELESRVRASGLLEEFETGRLGGEEFAAQLCASLQLQLPYSDFCEMWNCILLPETLLPEELLATLASQRRLLLLSNTNVLHYNCVVERHPMLRHFHDRVLSHEVGALKPDPKIYQAAIERAGCRPEECFFTDDIPAYVEGARMAGIDAVQFHSAEQLRNELRQRGIRC